MPHGAPLLVLVLVFEQAHIGHMGPYGIEILGFHLKGLCGSKIFSVPKMKKVWEATAQDFNGFEVPSYRVLGLDDDYQAAQVSLQH